MNWWDFAFIVLGLLIWGELHAIAKRALLIHLQLTRIAGFPEKELREFGGQ